MEKRNDKASTSRRGGKTNSRAATQVNAVAASSTPPNEYAGQLGLFPGRACPLEAKPAMKRDKTDVSSLRRDGVEGGGTRRQSREITGETLFDLKPFSREVYKGNRNHRPDVEQGVGGGHSTNERRENRREGRAATSSPRVKRGKTTGLPPRGSATSRSKSRRRKPSRRMDTVRKLQRTLYRVAKSQPARKFPMLYEKICHAEVLQEAWRRVKANRGAAGVDKVDIDDVVAYGEERFLAEIRQALVSKTYRVARIRRVHIPKPGQPGRTRPLGIPTVKDRVVQMAVKLVIEPLFEVDFLPCSYGFRPKRSPRMAVRAIRAAYRAGYRHVVDVDLQSYFDTIDHQKLIQLVSRRVADKEVLRLIRAWLRAGIIEDGQVRHPVRGTPQGGVISPLLSNLFLHEIDRQWCMHPRVMIVRFADDMLFLTQTAQEAEEVWEALQQQYRELGLVVNEEKSQLTTVSEGFRFLGFDFQEKKGRLYFWPCKKAVKHIGERVRQTIRSIPSSERLITLMKQLNRVLVGWCTYFRVGNSNRVFHRVDWFVRGEVCLWLRRKYRISWTKAKKRWNYHVLHDIYRLYRMVGKVSYL